MVYQFDLVFSSLHTPSINALSKLLLPTPSRPPCYVHIYTSTNTYGYMEMGGLGQGLARGDREAIEKLRELQSIAIVWIG